MLWGGVYILMVVADIMLATVSRTKKPPREAASYLVLNSILTQVGQSHIHASMTEVFADAKPDLLIKLLDLEAR